MFKVVYIVLISAIAIYFGTGGFIILQNEQNYEKAITLVEKEVMYQGIKFYNKEVMKSSKQQDLIYKFYPYAEVMPATLSFMITAICFGILGAVGVGVNNSIIRGIKFREYKNLLLVPAQGGFIGLIVIGICYTIPVFLTNENTTLKPITIVILSLFGGVFYMNFYEWFLKSINKIISKK